MNRREEIHDLLSLGEGEVLERAGERLDVFLTLADVHARLAADIADVLRAQTAAGEPTRLILPVGPTGQYPLLAETVNREGLSLRRAWLFFMDEYADDAGRALPPDHPLSFAGVARQRFLDALDPELAPPPEQVVFPTEGNIDRLADRIAGLGGIDACFGGVGIHGHLAFNEPEPGVRRLGPRRVRLNDFTVTINVMRARAGGNLEGFPRQAYTLGLPQILGARRLVLVCRNGIALDWANTVLRLTLLGTPGDDYPCTYATEHPNVVVYTDCDTLRHPAVVL